MKYKKGDLVKVKSDLTKKELGNIPFMLNCVGKIFKIIAVSNLCYFLDRDIRRFGWDERWLELVKQDKP